MNKWVEGTVVAQKRWTERLYSLQVDAEPMSFEAGQFAKLALAVHGEMVARPYSFVNAPKERPHEFYYVSVPDGPLTERLITLEAGDAIYLAPKPSGFLVLSEVRDADNLWLLCTGTALGPFLSILKTEAPWQRFREVVLVHAVREAAEMSYREQIGALLAQHPGQMRLVSFVSREAVAHALPGRVPAAIASGALEKAAGAVLSAKVSQVMICGNPEMVADTVSVLQERGMKRHRRRDPGQITLESYW